MFFKEKRVLTLILFSFIIVLAGAFSKEVKVDAASKQVITGFANSSNEVKEITVNEKISEKEVSKKLPSTLKVYLNNSKKATAIPVTWYCIEDDYAKSNDYYFQFNPKWNTSKYTLKSTLDILEDTPYCGIVIGAVSTQSIASNRDTIFKFLTEKMNLNTAAATGILANIYKESLFNPTISGDNETSYGICQWHSKRKTALKNWCARNGYNYKTLTGQLNYLKFELSRNHQAYLYNGKKIYNYMKSVSNSSSGAYSGGKYWCYYFEIPKTRTKSSITRGNLAKNTYWPMYKLSTPKMVNAVNTTTGIQVKWSKISTATGYYIYRKTTGSWKRVGKVTSNSTITYIDKTVKSGTTYSYTVRAYQASNVSGYESGIKVKCLSTPLLKVTNNTEGILVSWKQVNGASGYAVYRKKANSSNWTRIKTITNGKTVSYIDDAVKSGTTYTYTVRAYNGNTWSLFDSNGEKTVYLETPKLLEVISTETGINISWEKVGRADGYYIYRKTVGHWQKVGVVVGNSINSYTDEDIEKDEQYLYTVRAYYEDSFSDFDHEGLVIEN